MRDNAEYRWATQAIRVLLLFASAIALEGSSCLTGAIQGPTDKITQSFDNAIANLQNQSGQWQATLQGLQSNLVQQGQSTLANEVQSVLNRGVAATSSEFRCDISFLGSYLAEALTIVRAHFHNESPPPPPPHVCNVDPDAIDLRLTPDRRPATLNLYGFNFTGSNISISIVDVDGSHNTPAPGMFTVPTEFKATFNIVNYPFASTSRYVSFMLPGGEERRVSIAQAPSCGGVDQPCCSVGQVCDFGSGCLANRCVTCPPPSAPPVPVLAFTKGNEFCGNNCGGQDVDRTYGGKCDPGFHREQCSFSIIDACDVCAAQTRWANSGDTTDCTCIIHFHTPADCFKGMHVNISITETHNVAPRPTGCP